MTKVRIACVSLVTTEDKQANLNHFVQYIEDASRNGVNILVFPEYSSTGLTRDASMNRVSTAERKHFEDHAELIPQGETVRLMTEQAAKHHMYLCWTMIERDQFYSDRIYNTAVLVGPEGLVGTYRKVHRAGTEKMMFLAGDKGSEVFDTPYGKIENGVVYVDCNLGSLPEDQKNAEAGHSRIISPLGEILAETKGWGESTVVVDIDPQQAIAEYYNTMGFTYEEHLKKLKKQQKRYEKRRAVWDVILTNIRFYGAAIIKTALDFPTRIRYLIRRRLRK